MAKKLMVVGTMSSAGKSYIVTGLCRYFSRKGYRVAPFKSQNMALNSYVTKDGLEMGRAQVVQARACGKEPSVYMNPILLKPTTDVGSQVIVEGKSIGNMKAAQYFKYKTSLIPNIVHAFEALEKENDIIIIEGAGSPAEINLRENDIVNMGLAEIIDAPVVLVGDIDPGGVFAQLYGTLELLSEAEKDRIAGMIINKFRGDVSLLEPGIKMLEDKCKKRVLGVVPMSKAKIEEEDSITSAFNKLSANDQNAVDIAVIKLPRISNFTDFDPFKIMPNVSLRYVEGPCEIGNPDVIIIPGTKSTISDLKWLKQTGLFDCILGFSKQISIMGICGGYQMLGKEVLDPHEIEGGGMETGLGLLDMTTVLNEDKTLTRCTGFVKDACGEFSLLNELRFDGYEIHNGISTINSLDKTANVWGTYVHGIFDEKEIADTFVSIFLKKRGLELTASIDYRSYQNEQFDIIADELEKSMDFESLAEIMGL